MTVNVDMTAEQVEVLVVRFTQQQQLSDFRKLYHFTVMQLLARQHLNVDVLG